MQINPTGSNGLASAFFSNIDMNMATDSTFLNAMQEAVDSVRDNDNVSVSSAQVDTPYTRHTTDGVTYTLSEVCFTKSELKELRAGLLKAGAPEEALDNFDILADQPDGATLAQVLASLMGGRGTGEISQDDAHAITALLGQMDPSGTLATDALGLMRSGNGAAALELIQNALGKMGASDRVDVDLASLLALGRGMGLDKGALKALGSPLAGGDLSLTASQFDTLLNPAKNKVLSDAALDQKLNGALEQTLKPIITKARNRMEKEKAATALLDRRTEQSRILIDRTVQERSRAIMDQMLSGEDAGDAVKAQSEAIDRKLAGKKSAMVGHAGESGSELVMAARENANNSRQALNMPDPGEAIRGAAPASAEGDASGFLNQDKGKKDNGWQNLLGNMEIKTPMPTPTAASFVYSLQNAAPIPEAAMANMTARTQAPLPAQIASQVSQSSFTNMGNGAARMDLQLNTPDLGAIGVTLISRNGEVTAQLRSENTDTMDVLNRQAEAIRAALEQQGVKVDKVEVQLENRQDNGGNIFQDLGNHNARQEEFARRQEAARMRNLANLRNIGENSSSSALAQSMHDIGQSERYAGNALHVVA